MKLFTLFICFAFVAFAAARFTASNDEHDRYLRHAAPMGNEELPEEPQVMQPDYYRVRRQAIKNNEELPEEPAHFESGMPHRLRTRRAAQHVMTEELPEDAQVNFEHQPRRMVRHAQYMPEPFPMPDNMPMPPMPPMSSQ